MLKIFANIFATSLTAKEDLAAIEAALNKEGFEVAYSDERTGSIVKEVTSLEEDVTE